MHRLGLWKILCVLIFLPNVAFAQTQNTQRIYFVQYNVVAERSAIGKEILTRVFDRKRELEVFNKKTSDELTREEDELTQKRDEMSLEEFAPLAEAFDQKTVAARAELDRLSNENVAMRDELFARLRRLIQGEVQRLGQAQGATILDANNALYINPEDNLTGVVLARLDALYEQNKAEIDRDIFAPVSNSSLTPSPDLDNNAIMNNEEVNSNEQ